MKNPGMIRFYITIAAEAVAAIAIVFGGAFLIALVG